MLVATTQAIIAEARSRQHHGLADRMESAIERTIPMQRLQSDTAGRSLYDERFPNITREALIFPVEIWLKFDQLIDENRRRELLRSYGVEPRHRLLLSGPPGTGKTSLAELLATELGLPLLRVNYAGVFGSLLGETLQHLQALIDAASSRECVLFFDEFDTLGKTRSDEFESGEVKRVLNYLLLRLEEIPPHVMVVAATNRPDDLDSALWRRFELLLSLPSVDEASLDRWLSNAESRSVVPFEVPRATLKRVVRGLSFADLESVFLDLQREYILGLPETSMKQLILRRIQRTGKSVKLPGVRSNARAAHSNVSRTRRNTKA